MIVRKKLLVSVDMILRGKRFCIYGFVFLLNGFE